MNKSTQYKLISVYEFIKPTLTRGFREPIITHLVHITGMILVNK